MAKPPEFLTLKGNRDPSNRVELAARRLLFVALAALSTVALLGLLGQMPRESRATAAGAELEVLAPKRLRGGLFYQGRFTIESKAGIENARLVLDRGWLEGTHVNTIEPAPTEESSRDGRLALGFGEIPAGDTFVLYMQFQVNPTNVGRRSQDVELYDGQTRLAVVDRTVTIFP